jgi:prepilin signal peptidase PulO-like enzyme (type II secretory pathway)
MAELFTASTTSSSDIIVVNMSIIIALIFLILGIILGSFINAWVWRIENNLSVAKGRSMCPHCKHTLAWYDLIPVLSYVALKGKCRYCKAKISRQYPIIELTTGLLFMSTYILLSPASIQGWVQLGIILLISILLVAAYIYDAKHMELPEIFMLPAIALGVVYFGLNIIWQGYTAMIPQSIAIAVFVLAYVALWYFSKGQWLGAGDIRLAAIMALVLTPKQLLVGVFAAYLIGSIYGVSIIIKSKKKRGVKVPFGPFLIIGFYFGLFFGTQIANWYLSFI